MYRWTLRVALILGLMAPLSVFAGLPAQAGSIKHDLKGAGKETEHGAKKTGKVTEHAAKKTGKTVEKGTKKAVHKSAKEVRKGAGKVEGKTQP